MDGLPADTEGNLEQWQESFNAEDDSLKITVLAMIKDIRRLLVGATQYHVHSRRAAGWLVGNAIKNAMRDVVDESFSAQPHSAASRPSNVSPTPPAQPKLDEMSLSTQRQGAGSEEGSRSFGQQPPGGHDGRTSTATRARHCDSEDVQFVAVDMDVLVNDRVQVTRARIREVQAELFEEFWTLDWPSTASNPGPAMMLPLQTVILYVNFFVGDLLGTRGLTNFADKYKYVLDDSNIRDVQRARWLSQAATSPFEKKLYDTMSVVVVGRSSDVDTPTMMLGVHLMAATFVKLMRAVEASNGGIPSDGGRTDATANPTAQVFARKICQQAANLSLGSNWKDKVAAVVAHQMEWPLEQFQAFYLENVYLSELYHTFGAGFIFLCPSDTLHKSRKNAMFALPHLCKIVDRVFPELAVICAEVERCAREISLVIGSRPAIKNGIIRDGFAAGDEHEHMIGRIDATLKAHGVALHT